MATQTTHASSSYAPPQEEHKPWTNTNPRHSSSSFHPPNEAARVPTRGSGGTVKKAKWWHIQLGRGMKDDLKRRAPYYWSDWVDAWDYRVVPATIYCYFAKCVLILSERGNWDWKE